MDLSGGIRRDLSETRQAAELAVHVLRALGVGQHEREALGEIRTAPRAQRGLHIDGQRGQAVLCLRLQRGCGVRGWGRDDLGTGARGRGARARRALMSTTRLARWTQWSARIECTAFL